jgi:hypothetical protein
MPFDLPGRTSVTITSAAKHGTMEATMMIG